MAEPLHVYRPRPYEWRGVHTCPTCKVRCRCVGTFYEWHEADLVCGGCGNAWGSSWPFAPRKRKREALRERVRERWPLLQSKAQAWRRLMADAIRAPVTSAEGEK